MDIGKKVGGSEADVDFSGHSLGGGMASAASRASGQPATTFNSSGLNDGTVEKYGGTVHMPSTENIQAYRIDGDVLTGAQEQNVGGTLGAMAGGGVVAGPLVPWWVDLAKWGFLRACQTQWAYHIRCLAQVAPCHAMALISRFVRWKAPVPTA